MLCFIPLPAFPVEYYSRPHQESCCQAPDGAGVCDKLTGNNFTASPDVPKNLPIGCSECRSAGPLMAPSFIVSIKILYMNNMLLDRLFQEFYIFFSGDVEVRQRSIRTIFINRNHTTAERGLVIGRRVRDSRNQSAKILIFKGFHRIVYGFAVDDLVFFVRPHHRPLHDAADDDTFPVGIIEFINCFVSFDQLLNKLNSLAFIAGKTAGELPRQTVSDQTLPHLEEIRVGGGPGAQKWRIVVDAIGAAQGSDYRRRQHLNEDIFCAGFLETKQFRRKINRFRREFLDCNYIYILFSSIFLGWFMYRASVGIVVGEKPDLGRFLAFVDSQDVIENSFGIQTVTAKRQVHVFNRRFQYLPSG